MKKLEEIVKKLESITPERRRIAKIFKNYVEKAMDELGHGYTVDLQGDFYDTPIRITIEITPINQWSNIAVEVQKGGIKEYLEKL